MSKKKRIQIQRKKHAGQSYFDNFFGELEPVTDELIDELAAKGHDVEFLNLMKDTGFFYSRKRKSFSQISIYYGYDAG